MSLFFHMIVAGALGLLLGLLGLGPFGMLIAIVIVWLHWCMHYYSKQQDKDAKEFVRWISQEKKKERRRWRELRREGRGPDQLHDQ